MEVVAEHCTGWLSAWALPDEYPGRVAELHQLARARGRGSVDFAVGSEVFVAIDRTHELAHERSRQTFAALRNSFVMTPPEAKLRESSLVGSAPEVRAQVERYVEAGVTHFELKFISHTLGHLLDQMEMFQAEVVPSVVS